MRKVISAIVFSFLAMVSLNAGDFDKEGKIYGFGTASTLREADYIALKDLATKISVNVQSNIVTVDNGEDVEFVSNTQSITAVNIKTSNRWYEKKLGKYRVYRYIELAPYLFTKMNSYTRLYNAGENDDDNGVKCGYYYLAYCELKDPVMEAHYPEDEALKAELEKKIDKIIRKNGGEITFYVRDACGNLAEITDIGYKWGKPVVEEEYQVPYYSEKNNNSSNNRMTVVRFSPNARFIGHGGRVVGTRERNLVIVRY